MILYRRKGSSLRVVGEALALGGGLESTVVLALSRARREI